MEEISLESTKETMKKRKTMKEKGNEEEILRIFMEPEGSLPCWQKPATGPYPISDETNPYPPN
jgi:hypothetical protein